MSCNGDIVAIVTVPDCMALKHNTLKKMDKNAKHTERRNLSSETLFQRMFSLFEHKYALFSACTKDTNVEVFT